MPPQRALGPAPAVHVSTQFRTLTGPHYGHTDKLFSLRTDTDITLHKRLITVLRNIPDAKVIPSLTQVGWL